MSLPSTVVELLQRRGAETPDKVAFRFLPDGDDTAVSLTYRELNLAAEALATTLQAEGCEGERILLSLPPGLDFIVAYFGSLFAGGLAVPLVPPRPNRSLDAFRSIIADCCPRVVLSTQSLCKALEPRIAAETAIGSPRWIAVDAMEIENVGAGDWKIPDINSGSPAMIQYTSGSTSVPKGVIVSHANLLTNSALIQARIGASPDTPGAFWLPPYHDMGLIGGILQTVYSGATTTLFSPFSFLQRPIRWLRAISRTGAVVSGGPNFAFELCAKSITREASQDLDLSGWKVALVSAEPVQAETLRRFSTAFAHCGFRHEAFYPCYGLAECTLFATGGNHAAAPVERSFHRSSLEQRRVVREDATSVDAQNLVGSGDVPDVHDLRIVDPESLVELTPGRIGEVWIAGPSVAAGYWGRADETERTFQAFLADTGEGPFLRTGDLGFLDDGELFINGRLKALIIIRGRNLYPQDIELTAIESHECLIPNGAGAFSFELESEERLALCVEVERHCRADSYPPIIAAIRRAIVERHEVAVSAIVLLRPGTLPRTSSGKVRRHACKEQFISKSIDALHTWTTEFSS